MCTAYYTFFSWKYCFNKIFILWSILLHINILEGIFCRVCDLLSWGSWGSCNSTCDGRHSRSRSVCCNEDSTDISCLHNCNHTLSDLAESEACGDRYVYVVYSLAPVTTFHIHNIILRPDLVFVSVTILNFYEQLNSVVHSYCLQSGC